MAVFEQKNSAKVTLDDTTTLTCTIETAQNVKDHTEYMLRIQRGPLAENNWTLTKRYSDFSTLDAALRLSGIELPLPPKKVFGNMDREFIAERQVGLQLYLNAVLSHPILESCLVVKRFLDPHNYSTNLQELALQNISMFFRSEVNWEVVEPVPEIGCRLRKCYFMFRHKDQPKSKYFLSWCNFGPDQFLPEKDQINIMKLLTSFQHPNLCPVQFALSNENSGVVIRRFNERGSLRDILCKTKPLVPHLKKYGRPKSCACELGTIRMYGRQILDILKYLHDKGFPYGHLHAGNILVEDGRCQLLDIENWLLGLPPYHRHFATGLKKIQTMEDLDMYSFGHLIYEMAVGEPLMSATCESYPVQCPPQVRSILESILSSEALKNGLPCITDLLKDPFFGDIMVPPMIEKPQMKVPSKLKESIREAKAKVEKRLKDEQKVMNQVRRITKAQAFHMSEDEKKKRRKSKKKKVPTATLR